jgi:hypothetical protein
MEREGPALELLLQRIATTPQEFLAEPRRGNKGSVAVEAVVADLLWQRQVRVDVARLERCWKEVPRNARAVALLMCWVLADERLVQETIDSAALADLFGEGSVRLGKHTPADKFVTDGERREELARFTLKRLGLRPLGESVAQADDRLTSLSAAERARVLEASRAAEERARAVREALARKAAEESADKWSRE